jgi:hypothetical protein
MVLSFADRDMIMRYFGGGIGHLGNSPRHQVDSEPPDTEPEDLEGEMEISDGNNAFGPGEVEDIIMDYEVENSDDDDERGSGTDSTELDSDDDSDKGSSEESDDDSDDDGYGSF